MCGCGRTSMPCPAGRRAGPNSSTKMKGPTIVRGLDGKVRFTLKSPRSCVTGVITCSNAVSTVAIILSTSLAALCFRLFRPFNPSAQRTHRTSAPESDEQGEKHKNRNQEGERLEQHPHEPH